MGGSGKKLQKIQQEMKTYHINIQGTDYTVDVKGIASGKAEVRVNGVDYSVDVPEETAAPPIHRKAPAAAAPAAPAVSTPSHTATPGVVVSPLPGTILSISATVGQEVARGQKLLVLEAMKIENDILADKSGTVKQILVAQGDTVQEGQSLIVIG